MKENYSFSEVFRRPDLKGTLTNAVILAARASNKDQRKIIKRAESQKRNEPAVFDRPT